MVASILVNKFSETILVTHKIETQRGKIQKYLTYSFNT